jgi:hypothetical protein
MQCNILYLQQPEIIKMFLLKNIPGKVHIFFMYKQDIKQVNCMQNVTKYYILLRNVVSAVKIILRYGLCDSIWKFCETAMMNLMTIFFLNIDLSHKIVL